MSRLTESTKYGVWCSHSHMYECQDCNGCKWYEAMVEKLAHYENLEEQGRLITVIRCKDCTEYNPWGFKEGFGWCEEFDRVTIDDDYCSNAKLAELKGTEEWNENE